MKDRGDERTAVLFRHEGVGQERGWRKEEARKTNAAEGGTVVLSQHLAHQAARRLVNH